MLFNFIVNAQIKDIATSGCMLGEGANGVPTLDCVEVLFGNLLFMSSALIILILLIMFIVGGFNYLTSFGNPEKIKKAQGTLKYAIIGVAIYASSFLILKVIDTVFLNGCGDIFNFEIPDGNPDTAQFTDPDKPCDK